MKGKQFPTGTVEAPSFKVFARDRLGRIGDNIYRTACHAHTAPRGLQRGHGDVVGTGQLGMSRGGDCPLLEWNTWFCLLSNTPLLSM